MRISPRDQVIIGAVVTVLVVLAVFFLLILPRFGEIADLDLELASIELETTQANTLLERRQDAKASAADTQVQLLDVATQFPESPELPALIIELQNVANDVEMEFLQLAPTVPTEHAENPNITVIPVDVAMDGTWEQYIDFMAALGELRRAVRVTNFQVVASPPPAPEAEDGGGGGEPTPVVLEDEDLLFRIAGRVTLEAYMMSQELVVESGGGEGTPEAPAAEGSE